MLEAFGLLPDDARLIFAGTGPMGPILAAEARRMGLGSRVEVRGRVPSTQVPDLMRSLSAVVLPSITTPSWKEQFGRVLIEAMATGVPVVGSDSGEIPNVIGDAGLIVPEGDARALANALSRLHRDAHLSEELSKKGRARAVEHYSHRRIAERTLQAYRRALS
jgi:glycosyltransferase involved in cell wall biosynthesis